MRERTQNSASQVTIELVYRPARLAPYIQAGTSLMRARACTCAHIHMHTGICTVVPDRSDFRIEACIRGSLGQRSAPPPIVAVKCL